MLESLGGQREEAGPEFHWSFTAFFCIHMDIGCSVFLLGPHTPWLSGPKRRKPSKWIDKMFILGYSQFINHVCPQTAFPLVVH